MRKLLLLIFLSSLSSSWGQKYSFITFSTEEGLPQSQVTAITQDDNGYLWVGTIGGLTRFNGEEFVPFTVDEGLLNNRISSLDYFEKTLWVGHDGGISSIQNDVIRKYNFTGEDKSRPVQQIIRFQGHLLVCSNGGGLFELKNNQLKKIEVGVISTSRVRGAHVNHNTLYLATREGVVVTRDLKNFHLDTSFGEHSFSAIKGDEQELIATTYDSLLIRKQLKTAAVTINNPKNIESIYGCYLDAERNLWLYGKRGLIRMEENGNSRVFNQQNGLPLNAVICVFQDQYKNIWIGSQGKGLFRFPGLRFRYFDQSSGYISDLVTCGFQSTNGNTYLGTFDNGVLRKGRSGNVEKLPLEEPNLTVWGAIDDVDGSHWFGTHRSLIALDPAGNRVTYEQSTHPNLPGRKIVCFERISKNAMYIGGNEGVSLYRNGTFERLGSGDKEELGTVRDLELVNGELYCVSNLGMYVYRNGKFEPIPQAMGRVNYNLVADANGWIWVGSESGLFRYKNGDWRQFQLLEGDPRANIVNLMNYRDGRLYVGTNNGLFVIEQQKNGDFKSRRYGMGDGIPNMETNLNSGFFDSDGNFWFGTASGLVCYHITVPGIGVRKPIVHLKSILLNYAAFDYRKYSDSLSPSGIPVTMELPYNKNNLIFELDGVALVNHDELKYQFRLEGLNDSWSPLSPVSTITFTNLPAGDYTLMVRAVDLNGRKSAVVEMPFVIREAFFRTWWFLALCALLLAGLVVLVFRFRLRRIQERNENEMLTYKARLLALEQKSLNASMNRHFIFNALNSIQYFINTQDRLSANKYLTNFAKLIRKNLDSASWEDNHISLEEELSRIELYLSLESMRFKDRFDYEINTGDIDLEMYRIPSMILQPFIENSIIHGILPKEDTKGHIEINVALKDGYLEIYIRDNGIGVNQSISRKVMDAGDHRSQGMEITSKRIELMQKFSNKSLELEGPKEIIAEDGSVNGTYVLLKLSQDNLENDG